MKKNQPKKNTPNIPPEIKKQLPPDTQVKVMFRFPPKNWLTIVLLLIFCGLLYYSMSHRSGGVEKNYDIGLNQIQANYASGVYEEIVIAGDEIQAKRKETQAIENGQLITKQMIDISQLPPATKITDLKLSDPENPTKLTIEDQTWKKSFAEALPSVLSTILFVVLLFFLFTRMTGGAMGGAMSFIRSRARVYDPEQDEKVTFADVAGSDEEKSDLMEVVDFLKNPGKYKALGAKIPRGILLQGPPGTGKTLLARAVAGESNVPFFSISGSEFVEMFVGVGASRVRDLFREAREAAPAIIFIDEIDAIGKRRSPGIGGGHDEREQTLNQILTEMDGFDNDTNVIIMAATNRADVLDKALLRPGRFDRKVTINLPTLEDRKAILAVHAKGKPFDPKVDFDRVAGLTVGFSGAELGNLLNESAILAGRLDSPEISQDMIQKSIEKVVMGNEKKSLKMTEYEKRLTAIHEIGHAIVGKMLPHTDTVHKISILPRGGAGGVTWFLPEKDRTYTSKAKYLDELATLYGGRVAEEIFFGSDYITTGASSDIDRATAIARAMVMRFGFDPDLGAENYAPDELEGNFLGAQAQEKAISDETKKLIDDKVRDLLKHAYETARAIILKYRDLHETLASHLLEREEMLKEEFDAYFESIDGVPAKIMM